MAIETKLQLQQSTIEKLQQVIQANFDSSLAIEEASKNVADPMLAETLHKMSVAPSTRVEALSAWIKANDEEPKQISSWLSVWRRICAEVKASLDSGDAVTVLTNVERSQSHLKDLYEEVLLETSGSAMNDVLQRQLVEVSSTVKAIHDLRDRYSGTSETTALPE